MSFNKNNPLVVKAQLFNSFAKRVEGPNYKLP